ncbi:hypothetical protein CkaCkLH20_10952 [Colletotrichum karsti]|uniref:Fucose-specific lectin n=1 Tax=Colletotrichum karsti TaxID=1095194 RepID=A0A9P6HYP0_9PEZI|nr:uncharacterized protein CkaCkLH20_10952 [Colletotrichum karsti]KAF9871541.1 hypothetical protein CkaCkLH20_10952 [Colletotrichum karsti]
MQDPATGNILYSTCNSNSTPILPTDGQNVFRLMRKPRNGTALAGAGWYDTGKKQTAASVFFQAENGAIVNGYFECNTATGRYTAKGEYVISTTAHVESIHPETGLAVELLGAEEGYRLFFHDEDKRVNVLAYTTKTDWQLRGRISQDEVASMALSSVHSGQSNVSVVFPKDSENLEISRYFKDDTWRLATLPRPLENDTMTNNTDATGIVFDSSVAPNFTMTAWASNRTNMAASVDRSSVRSIFYIGADSKLHQLSNINLVWTVVTEQDPRLWPVAEKAGGSLTATSNFDTNEMWLWYRANGSLVQLYHGSDGLWTQASVVPSFNATESVETGPEESASPTATPSTTAKPMILSTAAKAGIGAGLAVGVAALMGFGITFFVRRRRQQIATEKARLKELEVAKQQISWGQNINGAGGAGPYTASGNFVRSTEEPIEKLGVQILEADTTTPPQELAVGEIYELAGDGCWGEMDATGQNGARRSIGGWREAQAQKQ